MLKVKRLCKAFEKPLKVSRNVAPLDDAGEGVVEEVRFDVFGDIHVGFGENSVEKDALEALNGVKSHIVRRIKLASPALEVLPSSAELRRITLSVKQTLAPIAIRCLVTAES